MDWLLEPNFYNWLIVAGIFLIIEVSTFTLLFLWLAVAALVVAIVNFFVPSLSIAMQLLIFSVCSVAAVLIWHTLFKGIQDKSGDATMNNRAERYVGRTATLSEAIENGSGKIQIDDSYWRVHCDTDMPIGTKVKVTSADGVILNVEST